MKMTITRDHIDGLIARLDEIPASMAEGICREAAAVLAAQQERIADILTKDSVKTREINVLVAENRAQQAEIARLKRLPAATEYQVAIHGLTVRAERAEAKLAAAQATIDALMLEYCPEDMTPDQIAEWGKHQVRASPDDEAALTNAIKDS